MKQAKLVSKSGEGHIYVQIEKNKIMSNRHGFVPVKNSPMYLDLISKDFIKQWYKVPKDLTL